MPLLRCTRDGKSGWKWGEEGKCYIGENAKENAISQGLAITGGDLSNYKLINGLPLYRLDTDLETDVQLGLFEIAFTSDPAIEVKGVTLNKTPNKDFKVALFSNSERKIVAGPALIPDYPMYRSPDKWDKFGSYIEFTADTIRKEYEKFMINSNGKAVFNDEHTNTKVDAVILESWIIEGENDKSNFYGFNNLPVGTMFIVAKILDDQYWAKDIKEEKKFGFSIEGNFAYKPVELGKMTLKNIEDMIKNMSNEEFLKWLYETKNN